MATKRYFESGASKRKRQKRQENAVVNSKSILQFFNPSSSNEHGPSRENNQSDPTLANAMASNVSCIDVTLAPASVSAGEHIQNIVEIEQQVPANDVISSNAPEDSFDECDEEDSHRNIDIGMIDRNNRFETESVFKIDKFEIPEPDDFPVDKDNHKFPTRLFNITLTNGEKCKRDWLCWSPTNTSVYCVPCFLLSTKDHSGISSFAKHPGWDIQKGWRKLKDKIPDHEKSNYHKSNYIAWRNAVQSVQASKSIDSHIMDNLKNEVGKWRKILYRILDIVLFLAERDLSFRGSTERIGEANNGNFLGMIELVAKYDSVLNEHISNLKNAQMNNKKLQVHYLSKTIQNELIELCGSFVLKTILDEIETAKYYSIAVDATPDISRKEQLSFILRYVVTKQDGTCFIEERFVAFQEFSKKTGAEIAQKILEFLSSLNICFENCVGQAYDNGANMAGKYRGVQAILKEKNSKCMFSPCGNHTLNLVGVNSAETCVEAVTFFGTIQKIFNTFGSSSPRWKILKKHVPVSLHPMSKTRWSARLDCVKPIASHLDGVRNALVELKDSMSLPPETLTDLFGILEYTKTLEFVLSLSIWVKVLKMIHEVNLLLEARSATLDVERDNIDKLTKDIISLREKWTEILGEAKLIAKNIGVQDAFHLKRGCDTQKKAEDYFRINVFFCILDAVVQGLTDRFRKIKNICGTYEFLWKFDDLTEENLICYANNFQESYSQDVSCEIVEEILFLKRIADVNFQLQQKSPKNILETIMKQKLCSVFPNIVVALRIFLSLPASVATNERSFSVLKRIKNYLSSTMEDERLNGLAVLNINCDKARQMDFSAVINKFAEKKARKALL